MRARTALRSARTLLDGGDTNGAGSRLYYAIFDAMRAVVHKRTQIDLEQIKTHHGLFMMFERHVIAAGLMDSSEARVIYRTHELRWHADYAHVVQIDNSAVVAVMEPAAAFVEACARIAELSSDEP
jgi:uncharacterized protein (UPF0332 family)